MKKLTSGQIAAILLAVKVKYPRGTESMPEPLRTGVRKLEEGLQQFLDKQDERRSRFVTQQEDIGEIEQP